MMQNQIEAQYGSKHEVRTFNKTMTEDRVVQKVKLHMKSHLSLEWYRVFWHNMKHFPSDVEMVDFTLWQAIIVERNI